MPRPPLMLRCEGCGLVSTPPQNPIGYECPGCEGTHFETHSGKVICDFCCHDDRQVVASYPARNFNVPMPVANVGANSRGWWAACADCRSMIERGERQELAERSADVYIGKGVPLGGVSRVQLTNEIRKLHDQFWSNREGPVVDHGPLTPDQEEEFRAKRGRAADD